MYLVRFGEMDQLENLKSLNSMNLDSRIILVLLYKNFPKDRESSGCFSIIVTTFVLNLFFKACVFQTKEFLFLFNYIFVV